MERSKTPRSTKGLAERFTGAVWVDAELRKGDFELVFRNGERYLHATIDGRDVATIEPQGFARFALGSVNIATTSNQVSEPARVGTPFCSPRYLQARPLGPSS